MTITWSEIEAYKLLYGKYGSTNLSSSAIHNAGDEIILFAEKIKAERAVVAMNTPAVVVKGVGRKWMER